jgi:hypothetical protein
MPDEEIIEESVLNPLKSEIQDPLLKQILQESVLEPAPQPAEIPLPTDEVDCLVIGTGAGGAPLLARLAMAGLNVVALEAGPWHDPKTDFAT